MNGFLQGLRLLAIALWVGGLCFFAFVLAPTAFRVLPTQFDAGLVVGASLRLFDVVAMGAGAVWLLATALLFTRAAKPLRNRYTSESVLVLAMLTGTGYLHFGILPAMERDRATVGGDLQSVTLEHPARVHFDRLHRQSERLEGGVLLLGLGVIFLMARGQNTGRISSAS